MPPLDYDDYEEYGDFCVTKTKAIGVGAGKSQKSFNKKSRGGGKQNSTKTDAKKNKNQGCYNSKYVRIAAEKQSK
jgi:hypothetical protein